MRNFADLLIAGTKAFVSSLHTLSDKPTLFAALVFLSIALLTATTNPVSALSPMSKTPQGVMTATDAPPMDGDYPNPGSDHCIVFAVYGVCVPEMDGDDRITEGDFMLWAKANLGEFACADLRADLRGDYSLSGRYSPATIWSGMQPTGLVARAQLGSLRFEPVNGRACWGYDSRDNLVVARSYYASGQIAAHWESDNNGGTSFFRRWYSEQEGQPKPPFTEEERGAWPFMSYKQERAIWEFAAEHGNPGALIWDFEPQGCEPSKDMVQCGYRHLNYRGASTGVRVKTYTHNGLLRVTRVFKDGIGLIATFSMHRNGNMVLEDVLEVAELTTPCLTPCTISVHLKEIDRMGAEVSRRDIPIQLIGPPPLDREISQPPVKETEEERREVGRH